MDHYLNEDRIYLDLMAQRRAWQKEAAYWRERHDELLDRLKQQSEKPTENKE